MKRNRIAAALLFAPALLLGVSAHAQAACAPAEHVKSLFRAAMAEAAAGLSTQDAFWGDARVFISIPKNLSVARRTLKRMDGGREQNEALVVAMNKTAGQSAGPIGQLLSAAAGEVDVSGGAALANGPQGEGAVSEYFRRILTPRVRARAKAAVAEQSLAPQLAQSFEPLVHQAAKLAPVEHDPGAIYDYVAMKTVDALFMRASAAEAAIRSQELAQASQVACTDDTKEIAR
jgi:hypothetical protein